MKHLSRLQFTQTKILSIVKTADLGSNLKPKLLFTYKLEARVWHWRPNLVVYVFICKKNAYFEEPSESWKCAWGTKHHFSHVCFRKHNHMSGHSTICQDTIPCFGRQYHMSGHCTICQDTEPYVRIQYHESVSGNVRTQWKSQGWNRGKYHDTIWSLMVTIIKMFIV